MQTTSIEVSLFFIIKSLKQLFPQARILRAECRNVTFSIEIIFKETPENSSFPIIEERARLLSSGALPVIIDMIASNAAAYLHSLELKDWSRTLLEERESKEIVCLLKDAELAIPLEEPLNEVGNCGFFKLLSIERLPGGSVKLSGVCFPDKKELKSFLKSLPALTEKSYQKIGKDMGLFEQGLDPSGFIFEKKGIEVLERLRALAQNLLEEAGIKWTSLPSFTRQNELFYPLPLAEKWGLAKEVTPGLFYLSPKYQAIIEAKRKNAFSSLKIAGSHTLFDLKPPIFPHGLLTPLPSTEITSFLFLSREAIAKETISSLQLIKKIAKILGFECEWKLLLSERKNASSTKDKSVFTAEIFRHALDEEKLPYTVDKALYQEAPRIEVRYRDSFGNFWLGSTIAYCSYKDRPPLTRTENHPPKSRENLSETQSKSRQSPFFLLEFTFFSSLERTLAIFLEKTAGWLPLWLSPVAVRIAYTEKNCFQDVQKWQARLNQCGLRTECEYAGEDLGKKIQTAEKERVPFFIVIDKAGLETGQATVRDVKEGREEVGFLEDWIENRLPLIQA